MARSPARKIREGGMEGMGEGGKEGERVYIHTYIHIHTYMHTYIHAYILTCGPPFFSAAAAVGGLPSAGAHSRAGAGLCVAHPRCSAVLLFL